MTIGPAVEISGANTVRTATADLPVILPDTVTPQQAMTTVMTLLPVMLPDNLNTVVREIQKNMVVINLENELNIEGYVTDMKWNPDLKELSFWLGHLSTSKKKLGKVYEGDIEVFFYSYLAADIARYLHNGMLIGVQGKLRLSPRNIERKATLIGAHVRPAIHIFVRIPFITDKGV
jgi:hypothetical protein